MSHYRTLTYRNDGFFREISWRAGKPDILCCDQATYLISKYRSASFTSLFVTLQFIIIFISIISFFFLTLNCQSKDEALHGEVPLNTFFLKDATIEIVPFHKHDKSCVFEIEFEASSGNKNRTLVLEAESEADRTDWVDALISHLQTVSDHSRCSSVYVK